MVKDKNLFAMNHCPVCSECIGLAFDKRMKEMPEHVVTSPFLCEKCLQKMKDMNAFIMYESYPPKHMGSNGLAVNVPEITGRFLTVSMKFFGKNPSEDDPKYKFTNVNRICFCDKELFELLIKNGEQKCQTEN